MPPKQRQPHRPSSIFGRPDYDKLEKFLVVLKETTDPARAMSSFFLGKINTLHDVMSELYQKLAASRPAVKPLPPGTDSESKLKRLQLLQNLARVLLKTKVNSAIVDQYLAAYYESIAFDILFQKLAELVIGDAKSNDENTDDVEAASEPPSESSEQTEEHLRIAEERASTQQEEATAEAQQC